MIKAVSNIDIYLIIFNYGNAIIVRAHGTFHKILRRMPQSPPPPISPIRLGLSYIVFHFKFKQGRKYKFCYSILLHAKFRVFDKQILV